MSLTREYLGAADFGFPRVSGDEPSGLPVVSLVFRFSPRERG